MRDSKVHHQGKLAHEIPLHMNVLLRDGDPILSEVLAKVDPLNQVAVLMISAILANFRIDPDATVFYSRDRTFYSRRATRRYYPEHYTYSATVAAVDALARCDFVEDMRTPPSPRASMRSRLRAATPLQTLLERTCSSPIIYIENETIVLRRSSKAKEQIDYVDTDEIRALRADVHAQNEFLRGFAIGVDGLTERECIVLFGGVHYDLSSKLFHRVFNGSFKYGGRWYGPAWQNMPRELRQRLTIDGSATCELDFRSCHPRLLCASAGLRFPFDDPEFDFYRLPPFDRGEVKSAVKVLLNAGSPRSARGALITELLDEGIPGAASRAKSLCKAVPAAWPELAPYWGSGIGLRLQRIDADICARVQAELRAQGVPVLSIHDGFIVPVAARRSLQTVMDAAIADACADLRDHPLEVAMP